MVLWMAAVAARQHRDSDRAIFTVRIADADIRMWLHIGPGDHGEPVATIILEGAEYVRDPGCERIATLASPGRAAVLSQGTATGDLKNPPPTYVALPCVATRHVTREIERDATYERPRRATSTPGTMIRRPRASRDCICAECPRIIHRRFLTATRTP